MPKTSVVVTKVLVFFIACFGYVKSENAVTHPICLLPPGEKGRYCNGYFEQRVMPKSGFIVTFTATRYTYDQIKGCHEFSYGGCDGNDNRFITLEDCEDTCGANTTYWLHVKRP